MGSKYSGSPDRNPVNVAIFEDETFRLNDERFGTRQLQHIYARHPGSSAWDTPCDGKYEPDVGEILLLVR